MPPQPAREAAATRALIVALALLTMGFTAVLVMAAWLPAAQAAGAARTAVRPEAAMQPPCPQQQHQQQQQQQQQPPANPPAPPPPPTVEAELPSLTAAAAWLAAPSQPLPPLQAAWLRWLGTWAALPVVAAALRLPSLPSDTPPCAALAAAVAAASLFEPAPPAAAAATAPLPLPAAWGSFRPSSWTRRMEAALLPTAGSRHPHPLPSSPPQPFTLTTLHLHRQRHRSRRRQGRAPEPTAQRWVWPGVPQAAQPAALAALLRAGLPQPAHTPPAAAVAGPDPVPQHLHLPLLHVLAWVPDAASALLLRAVAVLWPARVTLLGPMAAATTTLPAALEEALQPGWPAPACGLRLLPTTASPDATAAEAHAAVDAVEAAAADAAAHGHGSPADGGATALLLLPAASSAGPSGAAGAEAWWRQRQAEGGGAYLLPLRAPSPSALAAALADGVAAGSSGWPRGAVGRVAATLTQLAALLDSGVLDG